MANRKVIVGIFSIIIVFLLFLLIFFVYSSRMMQHSEQMAKRVILMDGDEREAALPISPEPSEKTEQPTDTKRWDEDFVGSPLPPASNNAGPSSQRTIETDKHTYKGFGDHSELQDGYGAYTYVLYNKAIQVSDDELSESEKRLERLLGVIAAKHREESKYLDSTTGEERKKLMGRTNVFCVPLVSTGQQLGITTYNVDESMRLTDTIVDYAVLEDGFRKNLATRTGPFLVTVPEKVSGDANVHPMLVADVSKIHPDYLETFVANYKQELAEPDHQKFDEHHSLMCFFYSLMSKFGECILYVSPQVKGAFE